MTELELKARDSRRRCPLSDGHNALPWALRERVGGDRNKVRLGRGAATQGAAAPGDPVAVDLAAPVDGTHTDLPRLAAGGVGAQFWSVFVPASITEDRAVATVLEQIDVARRMIAAYPEALGLALTAADVERIFADGRIASLLGAEGGHAIAGSLAGLRILSPPALTYITLTHNATLSS